MTALIVSSSISQVSKEQENIQPPSPLRGVLNGHTLTIKRESSTNPIGVLCAGIGILFLITFIAIAIVMAYKNNWFEKLNVQNIRKIT